jgi:hypothetical protein
VLGLQEKQTNIVSSKISLFIIVVALFSKAQIYKGFKITPKSKKIYFQPIIKEVDLHKKESTFWSKFVGLSFVLWTDQQSYLS